MPTITAVLPASLERELRETAARRGRSVESLIHSALSEYLHDEDHRLYQISTSTALVEGVYEGAVSSSTLLRHGDFGLGTFANLDGEMIILDGVMYQARGDGSVTRRDDENEVPFAVATRFRPDAAFDIGPVGSFDELARACDEHRESDNLFYALRIDGHFDHVHARAVTPVAQGTRLVDAASAQAEFAFSNVDGTFVCFWSPAYSSTFNIPGYHAHFVSKDRTQGGHVLDCRAQKLRARIQVLHEYDVQLPSRGEFLDSDLSRNPAADLAKTE
ncbi:MAG: acetolactate decarboxylase [Kofleriaceae bacterium]|nr:acetolactate decarboxylase [Kofleriaceae bacterium]